MDLKKGNEEKDGMAPPEMPNAYHRARRQLCLFSAILIFWEYVGIKLGEKVAEPPTTTMPLVGIKVRLENPEVIPVIMIVIVLYFTFRLTIEWQQIAPKRKLQTASWIDLIASYAIAVFALLIYVLQSIFHLRIADFLTPDAFTAILFGSLIGLIITSSILMPNRTKTNIIKTILLWLLITFMLVMLYLQFTIPKGKILTTVNIVFFISGFIISAATCLFIKKIIPYLKSTKIIKHFIYVPKEEDTSPED